MPIKSNIISPIELYYIKYTIDFLICQEKTSNN
jgi:hypothetical protein